MSLRSTFAVVLAAALPFGVAQAQDGTPEWIVFSDHSFATAQFAVPLSNDVAITLTCVAGSGDVQMVDVLIALPTGPFENRDDVVMRWGTSAGTATTPAQVFSDGVFAGVQMRVELTDFLIGQLVSAPALTVGLTEPTGIPSVTYQIAAEQAFLPGFLEECAGLLTPAETATPFPTLPVPDDEPGGLVADVGPAISGHDWQSFALIVEDNPFETQLDLIYGVPETDDVLANATCFIGAQGPVVRFSVAAFTEGLVDGDIADLVIQSGAGFDAQITGEVVGTLAEEGFTGIETVLEVSDPAWLAIAAHPDVRFSRPGGGTGFTLTGNGPDVIGPFLADCDEIAELTPESGGRPITPDNPQPGFLSCEAFDRALSQDTGAPLTLNFTNATQIIRVLMWMDPTGTPVEMALLEPGQSAAFTTDPGHFWMATDGPGNCREMVRPAPGSTQYDLTVE